MVVEIDLSNLVVRGEDLEDAIGGGRSQGHLVTSEGSADTEATTMEVDLTIDLHLSQFISRRILDGRQGLGELPAALPIPASWHRHIQGFMGSLEEIVDIAPEIEVFLAMLETGEGSFANDFRFQRAMKPLALAEGLGM
jgi:hypothetical protein